MPDSIYPSLRRSDAEIRRSFSSLTSLGDVAVLLEIPQRYLRTILYRRGDRSQYRRFDIPKRSGGLRSIAAPPPALAILQSKLNYVLKLVYRQKRSAHGFVPGRSILTNAEPHVGKRWVLNVDLKDFFPTINFGRVRGALMARPYLVPARPATVLAQLCTMDNQLPQGAPSSPMLSNLVCARLDGDLENMARRHRLEYTRYCDDLSFSSRSFDFPAEIGGPGDRQLGAGAAIGETLRGIIEGNGFIPNDHKTRLQFRDCHQEVTGLIVNEFPNVRRSLVREVRAMLHAWATYGIADAADTFVEKYASHDYVMQSATEAFRQVVKGKLEFIAQVRGPADFVYAKLRAKLHDLDPEHMPAPPAQLTRPTSHSVSRPGEANWQRHFGRVRPSVRQLEITKSDETIRSGSAFVLRRGVFVTAAHNLKGTVSLIEGDERIPFHEAILHPVHGATIDCALLPSSYARDAVQIDSRLPEPGEPVAAIGFATIPQRLPVCGVYAGRVEAVTPDYSSSITYIHATFPAAGGLSGSPVVNRDGQVIGIVVESVFEQTRLGVPNREFLTVLPIGFAMAIPSDAVRVTIPLPT